MARNKGPTEGGSGGKRGHSGMEHWEKTDEIKKATRGQRRVEDKAAARDGTAELNDDRGKR